jgi:hypothetical protein
MKSPWPEWWLVLATSKKQSYCPGCERWVKTPCVACAARTAKRRPNPELWEEPLALDLQPEHQERLEQLGPPKKEPK